VLLCKSRGDLASTLSRHTNHNLAARISNHWALCARALLPWHTLPHIASLRRCIAPPPTLTLTLRCMLMRRALPATLLTTHRKLIILATMPQHLTMRRAPIYPPSRYEMGTYSTLSPTMYPPASTAAAYPAYESGLAPPNAGSVAGLPSSPSNQGNGVMPRVPNSRPKPQCWEHGCSGRQFSTFSNLLRHQREKSGTAAKSYCPRCGAEFTRTTSRNGHMAHEKCKPRRTSDSSR
jgi:hypothetical protein